MKALGETVSLLLMWSFVGFLIFVFTGKPDLWDKWHAQAMGDTKCLELGKGTEQTDENGRPMTYWGGKSKSE
jgi:hypothetical protein